MNNSLNLRVCNDMVVLVDLAFGASCNGGLMSYNLHVEATGECLASYPTILEAAKAALNGDWYTLSNGEKV